MARQQRHQKATDVFLEKDWFLGPPVSFAKAFPRIATLRVRVKASGEYDRPLLGHNDDGWRTYTESATGEYIDCRNPVCYNGGFRIGEQLRCMEQAGETHRDWSVGCPVEPVEREEDEIRAYVLSQSPRRERVSHAEKMNTRRIYGESYDIWDVWTSRDRWWVITRPTNLYGHEWASSCGRVHSQALRPVGRPARGDRHGAADPSGPGPASRASDRARASGRRSRPVRRLAYGGCAAGGGGDGARGRPRPAGRSSRSPVPRGSGRGHRDRALHATQIASARFPPHPASRSSDWG